MRTTAVKDLAYYKANAEEDYLAVPISVLRYISELEKQQQRSYSEEDIEEYAEYCTTHVLTTQIGNPYLSIKEWFETYKI